MAPPNGHPTKSKFYERAAMALSGERTFYNECQGEGPTGLRFPDR